MTTRPSAYRSLTWLVTGVFLVGVIVLGAGVAAGSAAVIIIGGALALVAAACGIVLPRRGMSAPISFTKEWPPTTPGPRGRHTYPPRIDTEPKAPPRPPPPLIPEIHGKDAPHFPDRERSFAQHFNLDPHERLHVIEGQPYIELDLDEGEEDETLGGKIFRPAPRRVAATPAAGTGAVGAGTTAVEEPVPRTAAPPPEPRPAEEPAAPRPPTAMAPPPEPIPPAPPTSPPERGDGTP